MVTNGHMNTFILDGFVNCTLLIDNYQLFTTFAHY